MHVGHQQEPRGNNRRKQGKVTGISTPLALRRPWQILAVLAALFVPASGLIFAQSGFVPFSNSIIALDASPDDASIVVAGTLNVPVPAGIYRSTDGGHTWSRANADLPPDTSVASIRFDPLDGNRVLAADGGVGHLFISEDGGLNWRQEPSISQVLTPNSGIGRLFTRTEDGQTVFYAGSRYDGVVRSVDGGLSWEWYGEGLTGSALRVRAFVDKDGALYAGTHDGVWRLNPDSGSWQRVNLPVGIIARGLTILNGRLYVGTFASGLYLSDDGYNWVQDPSFPAGVVIYDLTASGQEVVVGTNVGLWTQSEPDWTRVSVNGAAYTNPVFRLASSSTFVGVTYAGTEQDGVLRTLDSGVTFLSSAHITPLDPAELPRAPTATPSVSPTVTETPPPTETPIPTETPTVTATHDPNRAHGYAYSHRHGDSDAGSQCANRYANGRMYADRDAGSQCANRYANCHRHGDRDAGPQCPNRYANGHRYADRDAGSQCANRNTNCRMYAIRDAGSQCANRYPNCH